MTGRVLAVLGAALLALGPAPARGQATPEVALSLEEAVRLALEHNLDLRIERYEPRLAREATRQASADFDPMLQLSAVWSRIELPINSSLEQQAPDGIIVEEAFRPDASLGGRLFTGTQYSLSLTTPYVRTTNPNRLFDRYYRPVLHLGLVQPLLKDFGLEVNLVRFRQAERVERIASLGVEARMLSVVQEVEGAYWQLVFVQEHLRVAEQGLDLAVDLLERLQRLLDAGRATRLDVRQAEAAVAARRAGLERAQADLANAQTQLGLRVNPNPAPRHRLIAISAPPEEGVPVDLDGRLALALTRRPEIRRQEIVIENLRLEELAARNQTLPRLDVVGGIGWTGLAGSGVGPNIRTPLPPRLSGDSYFDAFQDFVSPNGNVTWSLGLRLQVPLGNTQATARLELARLKQSQEQLRLTLIRNQVSADVQTAFQDMTATWAQVLAAEEQVKVSHEQLSAVERQFRAGLATARAVLEAQDALTRAEDARLSAVVGYSVARSRLEGVSGASFDVYRLVMAR